MTNTLEIVPASIVADSPFIDKKASPIIGKNVKFKPTPKPIAKPFLFFPVSLELPFSNIVCPSTEVVDMYFNSTNPPRPQPLAFSCFMEVWTGVPLFIKILPVLSFHIIIYYC